MRIRETTEYGIMLFASCHIEEKLLGRLLTNVRTHSHDAVDMLQGEITFADYTFTRGDLSLIKEPSTTVEICGFKPRPAPPVQPVPEFINGVAI